MSLPALKRALDALDEVACCEGVFAATERVAIMLPDGDVGAADDPRFVDWLLAHSELAPFGDGGETKLDPAVRNAQRLVARDRATVNGFDPALVLPEIEDALSPRYHLEATLTDVLVYPTDGRFARHRDTPYTRELVGTLVVGLPIRHTGGAFIVDDGAGPRTFDWGEPVAGLPWVALFSDVDHLVEPVISGARVTLVYALSSTGRRRDAATAARYAAVHRAIDGLTDTAPIVIPCARHVITGDAKAPDLESLRGTDRELAQIFVDAGFRVAVRSCVIASPNNGAQASRFEQHEDLTPALMAAPLPPSVIASLGQLVAFVPDTHISNDGGGDYPDEEATSLAPYLLPGVPIDRWVIRTKAAATLIHEALFDQYGFFGNGGFDAYLYTLAALEVTR
ncbi:MAG: 2OG-Fe(II) oxygenase [Deltaproteobacteria bacterium]|nr:2OG-Fe(II) oxygenase [Deltaproteobacteria bacterium]